MSKKRVVITGASDGIGKELAKLLAHEYQLVLCGRNEARLSKVAKECGDAEYHVFDLNDAAARKKAVTIILENGEVDVLVNNAGIWQKVGDVETVDDETIEEVIATNLTAQIILTKMFLPSMRKKDGTAIVNIITKSGITAQVGQSVYSASKWGLRGFTDVLRNDVKDDPIRIGAIYQSGTNTKFFEKTGETFSTENFTDPKDIADAVAYMLSCPKHMWINEMRIDK